MPVFLKPDSMFLGIIAELKLGVKTSQKSTLFRLLPWCAELYFIKLISQCLLNMAKGVESRGCNMWLV